MQMDSTAEKEQMNMSFFLTQQQVRNRTKFVTRRLGWRHLKRGERFTAILKGQGIPKGGKVERICQLECVQNWPEPLSVMINDPAYGKKEATKEGFPEMSGQQFAEMFIRHNNRPAHPVTLDTPINRIEFKYV